MKVDYLGPVPGYGLANIMWRPFHPARGAFDNVWPKTHPCHGNPKLFVMGPWEQPASDDPLGKFRARGYCASCFPEGDGICLIAIPEGKTTPDVVRDIVECFGWEVEVKRA